MAIREPPHANAGDNPTNNPRLKTIVNNLNNQISLQ